MVCFVRALSKMFWALCPIGMRFDWASLSLRFSQLWVNVSNIHKEAASMKGEFLRLRSSKAVSGCIEKYKWVVFPLAPSGFHLSRIAYSAIVYPLIFLGAVGFVVVCLLFWAMGAVLIVLGVVLVKVLLLIFYFWFTCYRYPIYEVVYPKLRTWILANNHHVYSPLSQDPSNIRLIRLKAGAVHDNIECELSHVPLSDLKFETLSYAWGNTLIPYKVLVNGNPFYVTYNLYHALKQLRYPDRERLIWIDAMCINQYNDGEKSNQVRIMRDIYASGSQTVVWLGNETQTTALAFEFVTKFGAANQETKEIMWKNRFTHYHWYKTRQEFARILDHEWWKRTWIIQEVVVAKDVVIQRGAYQVEWKVLHKLLSYAPFQDHEFANFTAPKFAHDVQDIRSRMHADDRPVDDTLLEMAYRFRHQSATFGSDKLYALLGLLKPDISTLIALDYTQRPEDVFLQFTVACLRSTNDLTIIAIAAGTELRGVSWCRDWRFNHDALFHVNRLTKPGIAYSASDSHPPILKVNLSHRLLSLQGYDIDNVVQVGGPNAIVYWNIVWEPELRIKTFVNWDLELRYWERLAGGPWDEGSDVQIAFDRTIVADCWPTEPTSCKWREPEWKLKPKNDKYKTYSHLINDKCRNRRFFVTKKGHFGLGPWGMKKDDKVCILLGGKTPFILRRHKKTRLDKKCTDEEIGIDIEERVRYHKVIGEAYVDGSMYYQGNMEEDIKSGKVVPKWYHLV